MPLNINRQPILTGRDGANGTDGARGSVPGKPGSAGTSGGWGEAARFLAGPETFTGDAGNDSIYLSARATGGSGGRGGTGGNGAAGLWTTDTVRGPSASVTTNAFGPGGSGGAGGDGGRGGEGSAVYQGLVMDLGAGSNQAWVYAVGAGGYGDYGGGGGSGANGTGYYYWIMYSGSFVSQTITYAAAGADGGRAGLGGHGGDGTGAIRDLAVTGANLTLTLFASGEGRPGYAGGHGGGTGVGATGAPGQDGGQGGRGGAGLGEVTGLAVTAGAALDLTVQARAKGGDGGAGGSGTAGSTGTSEVGQTDANGSTSQRYVTWSEHGDGGAGGRGGNATARFADSTVTGSDLADRVRVYLDADAGAGGRGGTGLPAVPSQDLSSGSRIDIVNGTGASAPGAAGRNGVATAMMDNVTIALGGGNDTLMLDVRLDAGGRQVFRGNHLDGGAGVDTIDFAANEHGQGVVMNLLRGEFRFGARGAEVNTITGFEVFVGTRHADVFVDGAGPQTYDLQRGGTDRIEFRPDHGHDVVRSFAADDLIRLLRFGADLDSFAEVLAATTETAQGARIATGADSSILLQGVAKSALTADMFGFV